MTEAPADAGTTVSTRIKAAAAVFIAFVPFVVSVIGAKFFVGGAISAGRLDHATPIVDSSAFLEPPELGVADLQGRLAIISTVGLIVTLSLCALVYGVVVLRRILTTKDGEHLRHAGWIIAGCFVLACLAGAAFGWNGSLDPACSVPSGTDTRPPSWTQAIFEKKTWIAFSERLPRNTLDDGADCIRRIAVGDGVKHLQEGGLLDTPGKLSVGFLYNLGCCLAATAAYFQFLVTAAIGFVAADNNRLAWRGHRLKDLLRLSALLLSGSVVLLRAMFDWPFGLVEKKATEHLTHLADACANWAAVNFTSSLVLIFGTALVMYDREAKAELRLKPGEFAGYAATMVAPVLTGQILALVKAI